MATGSYARHYRNRRDSVMGSHADISMVMAHSEAFRVVVDTPEAAPGRNSGQRRTC
jgi:hypothetical protein